VQLVAASEPAAVKGVSAAVVEALGESLVPFYARAHATAAAAVLV
jgi:hypothetical protein